MTNRTETKCSSFPPYGAIPPQPEAEAKAVLSTESRREASARRREEARAKAEALSAAVEAAVDRHYQQVHDLYEAAVDGLIASTGASRRVIEEEWNELLPDDHGGSRR